MYRLSSVVKNYTKGHTAIAALRGVDLIIGDGECLAIQGPTGAREVHAAADHRRPGPAHVGTDRVRRRRPGPVCRRPR